MPSIRLPPSCPPSPYPPSGTPSGQVDCVQYRHTFWCRGHKEKQKDSLFQTRRAHAQPSKRVNCEGWLPGQRHSITRT
ncbi:unnamed protein product [Protopolystoma xenopodis]|uniref:Uncharacterized protein n=1 Tax=Protopolystoma xenopodis TaxID=117903 RepID=A0A448WJU8_9PLAT|nr:unnamed protein product [Protopolystoma xenopodis]